jgi:hypothetical protein
MVGRWGSVCELCSWAETTIHLPVHIIIILGTNIWKDFDCTESHTCVLMWYVDGIHA